MELVSYFKDLGLDVEIGQLDSGVGFDSLFSFRIDGTALAYLNAVIHIPRSKKSFGSKHLRSSRPSSPFDGGCNLPRTDAGQP